jgi:hypothetical protein
MSALPGAPDSPKKHKPVRDFALLAVGFIAAVAVSTWAAGGSASSFGLTRGASSASRGVTTHAMTARALAPAAPARADGGAQRLSAPGAGSAALAEKPVFSTFIRDICNNTERYPEEQPDFDIMGRPGSSEEEWDEAECVTPLPLIRAP